MTKLTLPIQAGKAYMRRDGIVIWVNSVEGSADWAYGLLFKYHIGDDKFNGYASTGKASVGEDTPPDLVADWFAKPTQVGHPHAESMRLYAEDARTTREPWKLWQYCGRAREWHSHQTNPAWAENFKYRRTPTTIKVGDYEVTHEELLAVREQIEAVFKEAK